MSNRIRNHEMNDRMNAKSKCEWLSVNVACSGSPDGPPCLVIEGETEIILVPNVDVFREKMRKVIHEFLERNPGTRFSQHSFAPSGVSAPTENVGLVAGGRINTEELTRLAINLLTQAKNIRSAGRELLPTCCVLDPQGILHMRILDDIWSDDDKYRAYASISSFAREQNALAVITVNDAYAAPDTGVRAKFHPQRVEIITVNAIAPDGTVVTNVSQRDCSGWHSGHKRESTLLP
jgi:hypothetical protein